MTTRSIRLESVAIIALLALCFQIASAALGGHLCRGLIASSHSTQCVGECCDESGAVLMGPGAYRPMSAPLPPDRDESPCCIRASLVLLAPPTIKAELRILVHAPMWLEAPWPMAWVSLPPPPLARSQGESPGSPAELAVVKSTVLLL